MQPVTLCVTPWTRSVLGGVTTQSVVTISQLNKAFTRNCF
jgi:hypothetical protein